MSEMWKDIENEFKNQGPVSKAGVVNDVAKHIFEGGGFWYFGEVARHIGGKNHVYNDYYYKIRHLRENGYFDKSIEVALEAAEYARQKKDMLQFWGFIYEAGDIDYAVSHTIIYCRVARKASTPQWYWIRSLQSCEYYWSLYKKTLKGEKSDYYLGMLTKVAADAYKYVILTYGKCNDVEAKKYIDKVCYYVALSQLGEMSNGLMQTVERRTMQEKFLADVKGVCSNYQSLLTSLKREGVDTTLLEHISPSKDIYNEFMSLNKKATSAEHADAKNNESKLHKSEENKTYERRKLQEERLIKQERIAEEQERQRVATEQAKQRAKTKRRTFLIYAILIICVFKFISIQINANSDDWKIAYDNILTPSGFYEKQEFYMLSDMNFDGIPELISFCYTDSGSTYFDICTYDKKSDKISILYSNYNVLPCKIGKNVTVFWDGGNGIIHVYNCRMTDGDIDWSCNDVDSRPDAVGLLKYEEGDILSGAYKNKEADFSYLTPPQSSEVDYWDFDLDMAYQILSNKYTLEEVYDVLKAKVRETDSYGGIDFLRFDAKMLGFVGEIEYERYQAEEKQHFTRFSWLVYECIDERTLIKEFGLTFAGADDEFYYYDWNQKLKFRVKPYQNATGIDIYSYY